MPPPVPDALVYKNPVDVSITTGVVSLVRAIAFTPPKIKSVACGNIYDELSPPVEYIDHKVGVV